MPPPVDAILIGAGRRGTYAYGPFATRHPERLRFVAVAEPDPERRAMFASRHHIPPERQFARWEDLLARPCLGEAALICTPDSQHTGPALAALAAGYHVLLEKPMATTAEECRQLVRASESTGRQLHICHLLRYTRHFQAMRAILESGVLGDVIDVAHRENVSFWHMAHSYVRGNWRSSRESSPMILAKCCHDLDILLWLFDRGCERLSSSGALTHFRAENAPPGAPARCLDGCPAAGDCPYYAPWVYCDLTPVWRSVAEHATGAKGRMVRAYLKHPQAIRNLARVWPVLRQITEYRWMQTVLAPNPTPEKVERALREGPYGRCVYHCDNDVVDHQVVLMQFERDLTVTLTMHGHSHHEHRSTRIEGTRGRLLAEFGSGGSFIVVDEHRSDRRTHYDTSALDSSGHGGGDYELMSAFVSSIQGSGAGALTTARQALESHLLAFAAEQARLERRVMEAKDWR